MPIPMEIRLIRLVLFQIVMKRWTMYVPFLSWILILLYDRKGAKAMLGRVNHSMSALIGLCGIMVVIFLEVAYV